MKPITMRTPRQVTPEILDALDARDPRAERSRRDLRRINRVMASRHHLVQALRDMATPAAPRRLLELGAGDGSFMLGLAHSLRTIWPRIEVTLLDQSDVVAPATTEALRAIGWKAQVVVADVMHWIMQPADHWDVVIANLFLHHFDDHRLRILLRALATRTDCLVACEPRRGRLPLLASRLVGALGSNAVTRADAVTSVRAGFRAQELSAQWPIDRGAWRLREYAAAPFSHCFVAERVRG